MYKIVVVQERMILTQNPKLVGSSVFVVKFAAPQFVMSIPIYIDERHI